MFHLALHAGRPAWREAKTVGIDRSTSRRRLRQHRAADRATASALAGRALGGRSRSGAGVPTSPTPKRPSRATAFAAGLPAGLLARALGLGGGRYTLDAACASSLYALKLAADELLAGRADAMITGGLSRPDPLYTQMGFSQLRALSRTAAHPFDASGGGLVVGEGAGMFVLKRLGDAVEAR